MKGKSKKRRKSVFAPNHKYTPTWTKNEDSEEIEKNCEKN